MITVKELQDFEQEIVDLYHLGKIRSPVHLSGSVDGNLEEELIKVFKEIKPQDWVFTTYRSHYHALLKGMPKERLKQWILDNKSIHVMDKENKIVSTAIVAGQLSQAVGVAMAIKLKNDRLFDKFMTPPKFDSPESVAYIPSNSRVWVFCGDMTASLGVFWDCIRYSVFNELPITFFIEDNGLSTDSPTLETWGIKSFSSYIYPQLDWSFVKNLSPYIKYISYQRKWPHYGTGQRIDFKETMT